MSTAIYHNLLSRLVREGPWTMEETCFAFERKAREMGEDATLSVRQLRRWIEGRTDRPRPVSRRVAEEFWGHPLEALLSPLDDRTLNVVPEDQLQLPSVGHPHPELGLHEVGETTDRRRMLQALGGVVASAGLELTAPFRRDGHDAGLLGEDVVDVLSRLHKLAGDKDNIVVDLLADHIDDVLQRYEELNPGRLAPMLVKQRRWIDVLLTDFTDAVQQRQLLQTAGMTSGLVGYIAVGSGRFPLARAYCAEAYHLAGAANDSDLQAWVRATQSFCEYYAGNYQRAVDLALDGLTCAGTGPQSVRLMINGAARAYGKLGDHDGVQRTVERAYELMTHNDVPSGMPSSIGLNCYSRAQTASNAATAYVSLGRPYEVQQYAALALPEIHASASPWSRSLLTLDLASAQIRTKDADLDQACQLALDALARSSHRPIISVRQRAADLADAAAERWGEIRQVQVLREAIASGERGSA